MKYLAATGALFAFSTSNVLAHHPLDGMPMETFTHGILSGIGHPVLGFDHLFFIIAMGIVAAFTARRYISPLAYIAAMLAGCFAIAQGVTLPLTEAVIALSLLTLGGIVMAGRGVSLMPAIALFAAFGLFHGGAFGGSVVGYESGGGISVLMGYLIGLGVVQYAIAVTAGVIVERLSGSLSGSLSAQAITARLVGAAIAGVGLFLILEQIEGAILG